MRTKSKILAIWLLTFGITSFALAQEKSVPEKVTVRFQNNSLLLRKFTLVTYWSERTDNATEGVVLAPYFSTQKTYEVGTKVYFADHKQVDIVMSGKSLQDKHTPFMIIKKEDEGKTFKIFK